MCLLNQSQGEGTEVFPLECHSSSFLIFAETRWVKTDGQDEPQLSWGRGWNHRTTALPQVGNCPSLVHHGHHCSVLLFGVQQFPPSAVFTLVVTLVHWVPLESQCEEKRLIVEKRQRQTTRPRPKSPDETYSVHLSCSLFESEHAFKR